MEIPRAILTTFPPATDRRFMDRANCINVATSLFFPPAGSDGPEAKALCRSCEVQFDCLEYALANHEKHGIWGGTSERQRRRIARERAVDARARRRLIA